MGCQPSKHEGSEIMSLETDQSFTLNYRELVSQDRGQIFNLYHFSGIISRSNYSIVRKVVSRNSQQTRVCKIIPLATKRYLYHLSEVEFLKKLDHPNIVQIIEYFVEPSFLYIIFEQVPGSKILAELNAAQTNIVFQNIVEIMKQILIALDFCHRRQICHRALTADNVILAWNSGKPIVKIVDFSQACVIGSTKPTLVDPAKRHVLLNAEASDSSGKIDIFDCGFLFCSLLLGKKLRHDNPSHIMPDYQNIIAKLGLEANVQADLNALLRAMLSPTPSLRPEFAACLSSPFFSHFSKSQISQQTLTNLLQFNTESRLEYLLAMYGSLNMTSAIDKAEYIMEFYNLDKNKDGEIQIEQMTQGIMNTFNMSRAEATAKAEKLFEQLDKNRSGSLNFSEFVTGTMKLSKIFTNQFLESIFNEIDVNRDGSISEEELANLVSGIGRYQILGSKKQISLCQFKGLLWNLMHQRQDHCKLALPI